MPAADMKLKAVASEHRSSALASLVPREPTLTEVLGAVRALDSKLDQVLAAVAPPASSLAIDPTEIARTMALLRVARPVKETPP